MKTVSVRDVRQSFGKLLAYIEAGEEITVTLRRRAVAQIIPAKLTEMNRPHWPDFAARQKKLFGKKVHSNSVAAERETYQW